VFCQDFIYVKFDFPLCQPSVFPLPCKNGIVSSFWFAFLAVEYLWRAFNHSALNYSTQEVVKLSGTQNTRKNQHSQVLNFNLRLLPVTCQIVKRKTFGQHLTAKLFVEWPCVLWDTDTSTKAKPKETRSFILSLSSGSIEAINVFVFTSARDWHPS